MPELPEVESLRIKLAPQIVGHKIKNVIFRRADLRYPLPKTLIRDIKNLTVVSLERRSKYLLINTDVGKTWIVHLGMSGRFFFADPNLAFDKHDHVVLNLQDGRQMRFRDPRRFGMMDWCDSAALSEHEWIKNLGLEPLSEQFDENHLQLFVKRSNSPIKTLIMNSKWVVGVGNIYASESLFLAQIMPTRTASSLTKNEVQKLCLAIKSVLAKSIEVGGSSIRDYVDSSANPGLYQLKLSVYGRDGQLCKRCESKILHLTQSGRSSFYCPTCQK